MKTVLLALIGLLMSISYSASAWEVCFYKHTDYRGDSFCHSSFENGTKSFRFGFPHKGIGNDELSSIKITGDVKVTLAKNSGLTPANGAIDHSGSMPLSTFRRSSADLGSFNNEVSYVLISEVDSTMGYACAYEDANYAGASVCLSEDEGAMQFIEQFAWFNDKASSVYNSKQDRVEYSLFSDYGFQMTGNADANPSTYRGNLSACNSVDNLQSINANLNDTASGFAYLRTTDDQGKPAALCNYAPIYGLATRAFASPALMTQAYPAIKDIVLKNMVLSGVHNVFNTQGWAHCKNQSLDFAPKTNLTDGVRYYDVRFDINTEGSSYEITSMHGSDFICDRKDKTDDIESFAAELDNLPANEIVILHFKEIGFASNDDHDKAVFDQFTKVLGNKVITRNEVSDPFEETIEYLSKQGQVLILVREQEDYDELVDLGYEAWFHDHDEKLYLSNIYNPYIDSNDETQAKPKWEEKWYQELHEYLAVGASEGSNIDLGRESAEWNSYSYNTWLPQWSLREPVRGWAHSIDFARRGDTRYGHYLAMQGMLISMANNVRRQLAMMPGVYTLQPFSIPEYFVAALDQCEGCAIKYGSFVDRNHFWHVKRIDRNSGSELTGHPSDIGSFDWQLENDETERCLSISSSGVEEFSCSASDNRQKLKITPLGDEVFKFENRTSDHCMYGTIFNSLSAISDLYWCSNSVSSSYFIAK